IGRGERVHQQAIANQAAVDEKIDRITVELLHLRSADEAAQAELAAAFITFFALSLLLREFAGQIAEIDQILQRIAAEYLKDALAQRRHRRDVQQIDVVVAQLKTFRRMRQAV